MKANKLLYLTVGVLITSCETPGTPDFTLEHRVSSPLLAEKSFQFIGGSNAMIDTTSADLDSLFAIDPDGLVSLSQEFELNLGSFDDAIPAIDVDPSSFESSIGEISIDDFTASFGAEVGVLKQNAQETGTVNIGFGDLAGNIPFPISLVPPVTPALQVANSGFNYAILENNGQDPEVNFLILQLTNNTTVPLTNSDRTGLPTVTLFNSDNETLGGTDVEFSIESNPNAAQLNPGETGIARLDLRGEKMTSSLSYTLGLGTTGGNFASGGAVGLKAITTELRFVEASSNIDAQGGISLDSRATLEGDFVNAEIEDGFLEMTMTNDTNFPMTLTTMRVSNTNEFKDRFSGQSFKAGSIVIDTANILIGAKSQRILNFSLDGVAISNDLTVNVEAQTGGTQGAVAVKSTDEFRYDMRGGLTVKSASARLESQSFRSQSTFDFENPEFNFETDLDFVQLRSGTIEIRDMVSGIDLTLDTLQISFPSILIPKTPGVYNDADSLVILFAGANRILRKRDNAPTSLVIDLAGARLKAINNSLKFNIFGKTENTKNLPAPDSIRTVASTDFVSASVLVSGLEVDRAIGAVSTKTFLLSEDVGNDGIIELYSDRESMITEMKDLEGLSENVDGILFNDPRFTFFLGHNIGLDATIYLAISGSDTEGEEVFLKGKPGGPHEVLADDPITGLQALGVDIPKSNMLKITLTSLGDINDTILDQVFSFNKNTTNVDEFLSNLPSTVRIIGKTILNPDGGTGFVKRPLTFTSSMGIEIPINFATSSSKPISIEDTVKVELSDLPGEGDSQVLEEGSLFISYKNGLPLEMKWTIVFLDKNNTAVTVAPDASFGADAMTFTGGTIDPVSRFVSSPGAGVFTLGLTKAQLQVINKTESIILKGEVSTTANEEIKLRAQDFVSIKISANFKIATSIN